MHMQIHYPLYAYVALTIAHLLPCLWPAYYPADAFPDAAEGQLVKSLPPKPYTAYTHRLLRRICDAGITKPALEEMNAYIHHFQHRICAAVANLLQDSHIITVRENHILVVSRVLLSRDRADLVAEKVAQTRLQAQRQSSETQNSLKHTLRRAGVVFPPSRFRNCIQQSHPHIRWRVSVGSTVASAVMTQHMVETVLQEASKICTNSSKRRIAPEHIHAAVSSCIAHKHFNLPIQLRAVLQDRVQHTHP